MIIKRNNFENIREQNYSIAIGNFDGIHKGHKYLLDVLLKYKKLYNSKVAVLSFTPHPVKIMSPKNWKKNLVRFRTKYEKLKFLELDALFLLSFTKIFSKTSADEFVVKYLISKINVKNIVVGEDFKFGYNRKGDINLLKKYQKEGAFNIEVIKKKSDIENNIYSSSLIRELVKNGDVSKVSNFLGCNWEVQGKVVKGNALGRTLGFPTANLKYLYQIAPQKGIYACWTQIEGEKNWRMSAASSGTRPHYNGIEEVLEVYIFNYSGNLYQKRIKVLFVEKIRNEEKFSSDNDLILRMKKDCEQIKEILFKTKIKDNNQGKK